MSTIHSPTPAQMESALSKGPKTAQAIVDLYDKRDEVIAALSKREAIDTPDVASLDRLGRFRVADELWNKCTPAAQAMLKNDSSAGVRSAALIAASGD